MDSPAQSTGTRKILPFILSLVALLSGPALCEEGTLRQSSQRLVAAYGKSSRALCGAAASDLRTGRSLIAIRSDELFIPASNQKILTSAFALARLGADFHFSTIVYRLGQDIVIVGDGDPTLGDPRLAEQARRSIYAELDRWASAIKREVGRSLTGDLLLCSRFELEGFRHADWPKDQYHRWYAAPVAGLNFHDNCFDVTFTVADGRVRPHVQPETRFIRIDSTVKTAKRHLWSLRTSHDDSQVHLRGTVSRSTAEPLSVAASCPPLLLGRTLAERLIKAGVAFSGVIRQVPHGGLNWPAARELCRRTTPLAVAVRRANKRSLNLAAECIFLRAGDGTWAGSASIMTQTLIRQYGLDKDAFVVRDGGGLSKKNRISPKAMVRLLAAVAQRDEAKVFLASLPRSGIDGTMRRRLRRPPGRGRLLAKTGYVAGACCLSGYVLDDRGNVAIAFSILVNRVPAGKAHRARGLQDSLCRILVDFVDGK